MSAGDSAVFLVSESSQVGEARRAVERFTEHVKFDETRRGQASIIVTELATNLTRHAKGGEIIMRSIRDDIHSGIEVLSIDRGPGIPNLNEAIRDGFSTGGTPGNGLGAVKRLSSTFEAYSAAPAGTVLLSRLYSENQETTPLALDVGVVCLPKRGELACGDAWHVEQTPTGRTMIIVADGLGHGLLAAEASRQAIRLFRENLHLDTVRMMQVLHEGMRATRGAAIAVAEIKQDQKELRFTGVGNISASIYVGLNSRSLVSQNGTVGAEARRIQEFTYPWTPDSLLLMHSDGLSSQAQIAKYAGLRFKHPSLIAGVLYRDFRRERDDATVMVLSASRSVR